MHSDKKTVQAELLPFALNEKELKQWLKDFSSSDEIKKLTSFTSILSIFSQLEMPAKLRFYLLKQLSPAINSLSRQQEKVYSKSYFPFSKQNQLNIEFSVQAYSGIANNCLLLCEDADFKHGNTFSRQQKASIICLGIDAQAKVILHYALLYNKPGKGFWNLCFLFYLFAKQNDFLESDTIQHDICFINTFKQILLFELSNTHQFNTEEILSVFRLLNHFSEQVELLTTAPEKKFKGLPFFNLREDSPPSVSAKEDHEHNPFLIYVSSLYLIKNLVHLSTSKKNHSSYNKAMLLRLIKTLTMNHRRKSKRKKINDELYTVIGLHKVLKFLGIKHKKELNKTKKPNEIPKLDFGIIAADKNQDDIESERSRSEWDANLAIATEFDGIEYVKNEDIWSTNKKQRTRIKANTDILDQSITGFGLSIQGDNAKTKVGDIIGLRVSKNIVIGIIRRIISVQGNKIQIGVEKLGSHAKLLPLTNSKIIIYLKSNEGEDSVVIQNNDLEDEIYLFVQADKHLKKYKIEKQLHASSMVRHLKISPIS